MFNFDIKDVSNTASRAILINYAPAQQHPHDLSAAAEHRGAKACCHTEPCRSQDKLRRRIDGNEQTVSENRI